MQIGSRWPVGGTAPVGLTESFLAAVTAAEKEHQLTDGAWTLTWLEGRPVAEHPADIRVALGADGRVVTQAVDDVSEADAGLDDDDDWLS